MSKGKDSKNEDKKKPLLTNKEKRKAKQEKKNKKTIPLFDK